MTVIYLGKTWSLTTRLRFLGFAFAWLITFSLLAFSSMAQAAFYFTTSVGTVITADSDDCFHVLTATGQRQTIFDPGTTYVPFYCYREGAYVVDGVKVNDRLYFYTKVTASGTTGTSYADVVSITRSTDSLEMQKPSHLILVWAGITLLFGLGVIAGQQR